MKLTLQQQIARRDKVNTTAYGRRGDRIASIDQLALAAEQKRSVYCSNCWGLLPAAVVMNMAASCVLRAINSGHLYTYIRPTKNE